MPQPQPTAQQNLRHIATQWPTLRELLQARAPRSWPPAGRMADHQADIDAANNDDTTAEQLAAQAALEHAERTAIAPGQRPAPLRVSVLDAITELSADLCGLADHIAATIQRPPFTVSPASPHDLAARAIALSMAAAAERDRRDPRRWHIRGRQERTAQTAYDGEQAATWLADRLDNPEGPFRRIHPVEAERIRTEAAGIRRRLDRLFGDVDQAEKQETGLTCACGGELAVHSDPDWFVKCSACGTKWSGAAILATFNAA